MLIKPPSDFTKAHGVRENKRRCPECDRTFGVVEGGSTKCPKCGSAGTVAVVEVPAMLKNS
jgi:rRNA maturation endonuclease Nob1